MKELLIRSIISIFFFINLSPSLLIASIEEAQNSRLLFSCRQVDSLISEAQKLKPYNIDQYKSLSREALLLAKRLSCPKQEAVALMYVGCGYLYDELYYHALTSYYESTDKFLEVGDFDGAIYSLLYIVDCYLQIDATDNALSYIQKIERLLNRTKNSGTFGLYYHTKSQVFYKLNKLDEAEKYAFAAIYYFSKVHDDFMIIRCLQSIGDIKILKNELVRSIFFYQTAITKCYPLKQEGEIAVLYTRIGHVYQLQKRDDLVLKYNFQALRIRERVGTPELTSSSLINIGGSYLRINKYDSASYYLKKGISMVKNINRTQLFEHAYLELSRYYNATGNLKLALLNYRKYTDYHRKLIEDQNNKDIQKLEESREIRQLELRRELLKKVSELQNVHFRTTKVQTILLEALFIIACAVVILIYILRKGAIKTRLKLIGLNTQLENDINERAIAECKLRKSEELFRFLAEHSVDVISHLDRNLHRKYISPSCKNLFGYDPHELLNQDPFKIIDPQDHEPVRTIIASMIRAKEPMYFTYRIITKDEKKIWVEANANPVFDPKTGEFKEILSVVRNVSDRKIHEEAIAENARQKEILLREIHNRVKNNFAILISLMDIQKEIGNDRLLNLSLTDLQLRVRTMSLVHEQLYITDNIRKVQLGQYIMTLVNIISNAFNKKQIILHCNIGDCLSDIELALPLGLIVNELLTNAFKYAFPGNMSGNVWVTLKPSNGDGNDQNIEYNIWVLTVRDDGIGLPEFFTKDPKSGMGSQIIRILVNQIEGQLDIVNKHGAGFNLVFSNAYKPPTRKAL